MAKKILQAINYYIYKYIYNYTIDTIILFLLKTKTSIKNIISFFEPEKH